MGKGFALLFVILFLTASCPTLIKPILVHAQTNVETSTLVTPRNNPVENTALVVYIRIEIDPAPPTINDRYSNYNITIMHPDGFSESLDLKTFGLGGNYIDYPYGESVSELGNWTVDVSFLGQTFGNGAYYMPSEDQAVFTVVRSSLLDNPPPTPTPYPTVATNGDTIIQGHPSENVTILSPNDKVYNSKNVAVSFFIESKVPPLDSFAGKVLDPFFRYGCYLDYDVQALSSEKPFDIDHWNPHQPGFIPSSSLNLTLFTQGDGWLCNGTLTNLSQGPHHIKVWIDEELDYISYGEFVGSVFSTMSFAVDSIAPNIIILSPEPQTYNLSDVQLNFTVNKTITQVT